MTKPTNKPAAIRRTFIPQFWREADGRNFVVREIRTRVEALKRDCGADSVQKQILVERTIFIGLQLETMERAAVDTGKLDLGRYTQAVNCLVGLLRSLGLERKAKQVVDLKGYLQNGKG